MTPGNNYPLEILCCFKLTPGNCTCYFFNKPTPRNSTQTPCLFLFWNCPFDHPFRLPLRNWSSCTNFLTLPNHVCLQNTNQECKWSIFGHAQIQYTYCIVIGHYTRTRYYYISGHTIPNNSAFLFCRNDWYCSLQMVIKFYWALKNKERLIWKFTLTETWLSHQAHVPLKPSLLKLWAKNSANLIHKMN